MNPNCHKNMNKQISHEFSHVLHKIAGNKVLGYQAICKCGWAWTDQGKSMYNSTTHLAAAALRVKHLNKVNDAK